MLKGGIPQFTMSLYLFGGRFVSFNFLLEEQSCGQQCSELAPCQRIILIKL